MTEERREGEKPRTASLFKSMTPEIGDARGGAAPALAAARRRRRPGRRRGDRRRERPLRPVHQARAPTTRSLESEEQLFTITLDEALALLAQPKPRGRRAAAPPLRELGADPVSGKPIVVKQRPLRPVRHRRRDEREPAQRRRRRDAHLRAGGRADGRSAASAGRRSRSAPKLSVVGAQGIEPIARHASALDRAILAAASGRSLRASATVRSLERTPRAGCEVRTYVGKNRSLRLAIRGQMSYGANA